VVAGGHGSGEATLCHPALASPSATISARPFTGASAPTAASSSSAPAVHSVHILSASDACGHVWWASVDVSVSASHEESDGTEYEIADVTSFSGGDAAFSLRPDDFEFISRDGSIHRPLSPPPAGIGSPLPAATLTSGEGARGIVVFHVPAGGGQVVARSDGEGRQLTWPAAS
jgi:hypothetical protein